MDSFSGQIRSDQASSFQAMENRAVQVINVVMQDPAVDGLNAYVGGGNGFSTARMFVTLKPLAERKLSSDQVIKGEGCLSEQGADHCLLD